MDIKDQLRQAAKEGRQIHVSPAYDNYLCKWHMLITWQDQQGEQTYWGKGFRAPSATAAEAKIQRQYDRLIGKSTSTKYSQEYRQAKAAFEQKIAAVLESEGLRVPNVIASKNIRIDKMSGNPLFKVTRGTTPSGLRERYDPEYRDFQRALRIELENLQQ